MLPLESQVCSLDLAKIIKKLGVNQKSMLSWMKKLDGQWIISSYYGCDCWAALRGKLILDGLASESDLDFCAAFTVAELLNLLPSKVTTDKNPPFNNFRLHITNAYICNDNDINKLTRNFLFNYECDTAGHETQWLLPKLTKNIFDENPANAAAEMLLFLIKNNIIKVEDINE